VLASDVLNVMPVASCATVGSGGGLSPYCRTAMKPITKNPTNAAAAVAQPNPTLSAIERRANASRSRSNEPIQSA
jgi:hypothetical protein